MKNEASFLHSLADTFEYRPSALYSFEELGEGPQNEYHIAIFFRNVVASILQVDVESALHITKYSTLYNITNTGSTVYGLLFVLDKDRVRTGNNYVLVYGGRKLVGDFAPFAFASRKYGVSLYCDSSGALLINTGTVTSDFVVLDD